MANRNRLVLLGILYSNSSLAKLIPRIRSTDILVNNIRFYEKGSGVPKKQYTNKAKIMAVLDDRQSIIDFDTLLTALLASKIA